MTNTTEHQTGTQEKKRRYTGDRNIQLRLTVALSVS